MRDVSGVYLVAVVSVCLLAGCGFSNVIPVTAIIPPSDTPVATPTEEAVSMVFEDPGTIVVFHGHACAESDRPGAENRLRLKQELKLPPYAVSATVFLNGWNMRYLHAEHHVGAMATAIYAISRARETLAWEAGALLTDRNFDDAYGWCYRYTVIGWNPAALLAVADHVDADHVMYNPDNGNTSALKDVRGFLPTAALPAREPVAVLPRGFFLGYSLGGVDHEVLQLAFNLDSSEKYAEHDKKYSQITGIECCTFTTPTFPSAAHHADGYVSWDTKQIFKDNARRRDYNNAELVSALGGADVGVIQPPFTFLPREDSDADGCVQNPGGTQTRDVVTNEVPFEYAVPMLTGWEVGNGCDDLDIRKMGAWIERFSYTRPTFAGAAGILRYTLSTQFEDNDVTLHISRTRAHILGFKRIESRVAPPPKPPPIKARPAKPKS